MSRRRLQSSTLSGKPRWSFQAVKKDVWDYDFGSPPSLIDYKGTAAILIPSKQGDLFVLDRATGLATDRGDGDLLTLDSKMARKDIVAQSRLNHDRYERWRDGRLVETELELFAYRVWGLKEFEMALARVGFSDIEVCGNYRWCF